MKLSVWEMTMTTLVPTEPTEPTSADIRAVDQLTPAELDAAAQVARAFDEHDSNSVSAFGVGVQSAMAALADPLLKAVAAKDAGQAGEVLTSLMLQVKALDTRSLASQAESALARLPLAGRYFTRLRAFVARYQKISVVIDRIVLALDNSRKDLNRDVALLDQLYAQNTTCYRQLLVYIAAGEMRLAEMRAAYAAGAESARVSADPIASQATADLANTITRLERRVYDLKLSATASLQAAPKLRIIQSGDQALVEKIQTSIMLTIPLWKTQVAMAINLLTQKRALAQQREVDRTTNDMLRRGADQAREANAAVQREAERGLVDLETLQHTHDQLLATIDDSLRIQAEGRRQRREAEQQLERMQQELRARLTAPRDGSTN